MIGYLPSMYENEILYSYIARYHRCTPLNSHRDTIEDLFGVRSIASSLEFPSHLEAFEANTSLLGKSKEDILLNHTIYPLYEPFLYCEEQDLIRRMMWGFNGSGIKAKIGFLAGSICKKKHLYYCPLCAKEDFGRYGEMYLRSLHQMQGVFGCPTHLCWLEKYPVTQAMVSRLEYVWCDYKQISNVKSRLLINAELKSLTYDFQQVFNGVLINADAELLKEKYLLRLEQMGFLTIEKSVKVVGLCNLFNNSYKLETLIRLNSYVDYSNDHNWLAKLFRKKVCKVHPIRHLLIINILFEGLGELVQLKGDREKKIYPCLNPVCEKFKQLIIGEVIVTADYHSRVPVGTFKCPTCGFMYSRKMSDDIYKVGRIKEFGPIWKKRLIEIAGKDISLRAKSRLMGCDPATIKKYWKLLK